MFERSAIAASRGPMAAFVGIGVVWGAFMATLPDLKEGLGIGDGELGLVLVFGSIAAIAMMLAAPRIGGVLGGAALPLGAAAMGLGRLAGQAMAARIADRALLRGGLIVAVAGAAAVAAAPGVLAVYAAFMLMGLGISVVVPTALAMAGRLAEPAARSRAIARTTVLGYVGFFLGPPVLGFVAELAGLRASYGLVAALLLAALALQARLARLDR